MTLADCLPHAWPRLPPQRVAEIVGWNLQHKAWVAAHTLGGCVRVLPLAVLPALPMVGADIVIPMSEQVQQVPAGTGEAREANPLAPGTAGLAPVFPAAPYAGQGYGPSRLADFSAVPPAPHQVPLAPVIRPAAHVGVRPADAAPQGPAVGLSPATPLDAHTQPPTIPNGYDDLLVLDTTDHSRDVIADAPTPVDEPGSMALLGAFCLALGILRRFGGHGE